MRWVVVHKPVEIDGQTFLPRREGLSFIPRELESKMTANVRKSCVQVPDKFYPVGDTVAPVFTPPGKLEV